MSISTRPAANAPMIFDPSTEGTIALCNRWNDRAFLTLPEFHDMLRESSTEAREHGCINKLSGMFAYVDANGDEQEHSFRIDAYGDTISRTLADHFDGWVKFYATKRGETYARQYGKRPASEAAAHFASLAAIVRAAA